MQNKNNGKWNKSPAINNKFALIIILIFKKNASRSNYTHVNEYDFKSIK